MSLDGNGKPQALDVDGAFPGVGFPGTEGTTGFAGGNKIISPNSLVFVVDEDDDLTTYETFPEGQQISMRITNGVLAKSGKALLNAGLASSTVGADTITPEVAQSPPPFSIPNITPGNGEQGVDPLQNIVVEFTEPIQPYTLAPLPSSTPPTLGSAIQVRFGPSASTVDVPFFVQPLSPYDLTRYELLPAFNFPGAGPASDGCGTFNRVDVTVNSAQFSDLTVISEETGTPSAEEMICQLVEGQEAIARTARSVFPAAEKAGDEPTADLLTQRMQLHEKNAWMLRSLLA